MSAGSEKEEVGRDARVLAEEIEREANRIEAATRPRDGPGDELGELWWDGRRYDMEIEPAAWKLLKVLWGKASMGVPDVLKALKKPLGTTYGSLKPTVSRLNTAVAKAHLPFLVFTWSKKRSENLIICTPPPVPSSVSDKFQS
jgi:hypothetical protein